MPNPKSNDKYVEIENVEQEITKKAKGAYIKSRLESVESGEINTNCFKNLEKSRQTRKRITCLKVGNWIISEDANILITTLKRDT